MIAENESDYWKNGEPCNHPGCLNHISHSCEKCGRVMAKGISYKYSWLGLMPWSNPTVISIDPIFRVDGDVC